MPVLQIVMLYFDIVQYKAHQTWTLPQPRSRLGCTPTRPPVATSLRYRSTSLALCPPPDHSVAGPGHIIPTLATPHPRAAPSKSLHTGLWVWLTCSIDYSRYFHIRLPVLFYHIYTICNRRLNPFHFIVT
jgi:hypothetical protein